MAVEFQKTGDPKWLALVSGHKDDLTRGLRISLPPTIMEVDRRALEDDFPGEPQEVHFHGWKEGMYFHNTFPTRHDCLILVWVANEPILSNEPLRFRFILSHPSDSTAMSFGTSQVRRGGRGMWPRAPCI